MANYNLENILAGDKWMVDAGIGQVVGVSSSGTDTSVVAYQIFEPSV